MHFIRCLFIISNHLTKLKTLWAECRPGPSPSSPSCQLPCVQPGLCRACARLRGLRGLGRTLEGFSSTSLAPTLICGVPLISAPCPILFSQAELLARCPPEYASQKNREPVPGSSALPARNRKGLSDAICQGLCPHVTLLSPHGPALPSGRPCAPGWPPAPTLAWMTAVPWGPLSRCEFCLLGLTSSRSLVVPPTRGCF